jgi:hypothetical protein
MSTGPRGTVGVHFHHPRQEPIVQSLGRGLEASRRHQNRSKSLMHNCMYLLTFNLSFLSTNFINCEKVIMRDVLGRWLTGVRRHLTR